MPERPSEEDLYESPRARAQRTSGRPDQSSRAFRMRVIPVTLLSFYGCFSLLVGTCYLIVILFVVENSIIANRPEEILLFLACCALAFLIGLAALVAAWSVWRERLVMGAVLGIGSVAASPVIGFYILILSFPISPTFIATSSRVWPRGLTAVSSLG